jgi:hypothetical protein
VVGLTAAQYATITKVVGAMSSHGVPTPDDVAHIVCFAKQGRVVLVTCGCGSHLSPRITPAGLASMRRHEALRALEGALA